MDSVAGFYLNVDTIHYEDVAGKGAKQLTFNQVDLEQAAPYAAEDAEITLRLHEHLWERLGEIPSLRSVYEDIEQPLVPVLLGMEEAGVLLDRDMLKTQSSELAKSMAATRSHRRTNSPAAPSISVRRSSCRRYCSATWACRSSAKRRKASRRRPRTCCRNLLTTTICRASSSTTAASANSRARTPTSCRNRSTARPGGSIRPTTRPWRRPVGLSSTDPNLQNIPIRTEAGRRIRQAFVPPDGQVLLAADYSQIELRIMAHLSGDEGLLNAFRDDQDIHAATAAEVFEVDDVTADHRRSAKAINFGLMYGMSAFGLAKQLGISRGEAQEYIDLYFDRYPGVRQYMDDTREKARSDGYVETEFGRRLYLPEINDRNMQRRQYAERSAINAPMQGTAADIIKRAMITVQDWLRTKKVPARMIMQVHDELVFEVAEGSVDTCSRRHRAQLMSKAAELSVPLKVDAGIGANWDEAH